MYFVVLSNPTKLFGRKSGKLSLNFHFIFSCFVFHQKFYLDCSSGYALTTCLEFAPKIWKLPWSSENIMQTRRFLKNIFFPANCSSGSFECCFDNTDVNFIQKFEKFLPNCFFWICFERKPSECLFGLIKNNFNSPGENCGRNFQKVFAHFPKNVPVFFSKIFFRECSSVHVDCDSDNLP